MEDTNIMEPLVGGWNQRIDIKLDIGITRARNLDSIRSVLVVQTVCLLPCIRNTITIGVSGLGSTSDGSRSVHRAGGLVADQLSSLAPTLDLGYKALVDGVARWECGADIGENPGHGVLRRAEGDWTRVGEFGCDNIHVAVASGRGAESGTIENTVPVRIVEVV